MFHRVVHLFAIYSVSSPVSFYPFALKFYFGLWNIIIMVDHCYEKLKRDNVLMVFEFQEKNLNFLKLDYL